MDSIANRRKAIRREIRMPDTVLPQKTANMTGNAPRMERAEITMVAVQ